MLVNCQFTLCDARPFGADADTLLGVPNWPLPLDGVEFERCFGLVKRRRRGGIEVFEDELYYARAVGGLRFDRLEVQSVGEKPNAFVPYGAFRRLFSNGGAVARIEVGLSNHTRRRIHHLRGCNGRQLVRIALDVLDLPVRVMKYRSREKECRLGAAGPALAALYGAATATGGKAFDKRLLHAATPLLVIEYEPGEVEWLPAVASRMDPQAVAGANVSFLSIDHGKQQIGTWLLDLESADRGQVRRLRVGLNRLHAEHQTLKWILHVCSLRHRPIPAGERREALRDYLQETSAMLAIDQRAGLSPAAIHDLLASYDRLSGSEDRALMARRLKKLERDLDMPILVGPPPRGPLPRAEKPVRVFVCYSHRDGDECQELVDYLSGLERFHFFSDHALEPGERWDGVIRDQLEQADIALFLVSRWFLDSPYIKEVELRRLLERGESRVRLVPIMVGKVDLSTEPWLSALQVWPRDGKNIREHFESRGPREALFEEIRSFLGGLAGGPM